MASPPPLELDPRWFTILAQTESAAIVQSASGNISVWRLEWRDVADYPPGMSPEAWEKYVALLTQQS